MGVTCRKNQAGDEIFKATIIDFKRENQEKGRIKHSCGSRVINHNYIDNK